MEETASKEEDVDITPCKFTWCYIEILQWICLFSVFLRNRLQFVRFPECVYVVGLQHCLVLSSLHMSKFKHTNPQEKYFSITVLFNHSF